MIIDKVKIIGKMDNTLDNTFESANRVYDKNGVSPSLDTCGGGNLQPKVIEEAKCVGGLTESRWGGAIPSARQSLHGRCGSGSTGEYP